MTSVNLSSPEIIRHRRKLHILTNETFEIERLSLSADDECHNCSADHYHYHQSYEIFYLCSGERYYFIKDKSYHVTAGSFVLINKQDIHYTAAPPNPEYERFVINFSDDFVSEILDAIGEAKLMECFNSDIHVVNVEEKDRAFIQNLFETLLYEYESKKQFSKTYIQTIFLQLLIFINRNQKASSPSEPNYISSSHKIIAEITGYINTHCNENITLEYLSEKYYISPHYLSRIFSNITGLTFVEYMSSVRIKEAQRLLQKTNLTIAQISEAVGYNSSTHFRRIFKKLIGVSPLSYRKEKQNNSLTDFN